jgi:hypothetical protein
MAGLMIVGRWQRSAAAASRGRRCHPLSTRYAEPQTATDPPPPPQVCRHHAAAVATGCGRGAEAFECPYHGWTYDLQGRLRKAPRVKGIKGFKASEWGLKPIELDTFGPFIFLWFGGSSSSSDSSSSSGSGGAGLEAAESPPPVQQWLGECGYCVLGLCCCKKDTKRQTNTTVYLQDPWPGGWSSWA